MSNCYVISMHINDELEHLVQLHKQESESESLINLLCAKITEIASILTLYHKFVVSPPPPSPH